MRFLLLMAPLLAADTSGLVDEETPPEWEIVAPTENSLDTSYIINGTDAALDDYPASGVLLMDILASRQNYRLFMCSAALIAPDVVLLAAHCVDEDTLTASLGAGTVTIEDARFSRAVDVSMFTGRSTPDWPSDAVAANEWVRHEAYNYRSIQTGLAENNDVGLLFLSTPILDVPYTYLVTAEEASQLVEGESVVVVGWGYQDSKMRGEYGTKQMGTSPIAGVGTAEFQVGYAQADVRQCHGDSGGPVYMEVTTSSTETLRHVGLTSHTYDNSQCMKTGAVNTRTDVMLDWIDQQMRSRCEAGTRVWCDVPGVIPPPQPAPPEETGETGDDGNGDGGGDKDGTCGCATPGPRSGLAPLGLLLVGLALTRKRRG